MDEKQLLILRSAFDLRVEIPCHRLHALDKCIGLEKTAMTLRIGQGKQRGSEISISVNGANIIAFAGESVAVAMLSANIRKLRTSPRNGDPRGPFCFMGSCQECLVMIDGKPQLACQTQVSDGLSVELGFSHERNT